MNDLERFLAVVRGEASDYVPLFGGHALGSQHKGGFPGLWTAGLPTEIGPGPENYDAWFAY